MQRVCETSIVIDKSAYVMDRKEVHIGEIIESQFNAKKAKGEITRQEFAMRLCKTPPDVNNIFKRKSIDTDLLLIIGEILDFDFFSIYCNNVVDKEIKLEITIKNGNITHSKITT
ncbi:MAG: hypothetical protein LBR17_04135 [Bacteroidales bacterium]|jgi:hypothetical protein|nr:hypothetical protein [Bacteroidales bacterium]